MLGLQLKYLLTEPAENVKNGRNTIASLKSGWWMATYDRTANNAPDWNIIKETEGKKFKKELTH